MSGGSLGGRLRILHTEASRGWGGQEIRVLTEAGGLARRGHELLLAAPEAAAPGAAVPEATASGATGSEANGSETTGSEIASPDTLVARAVRANVRLSAGRLRRESAVLARLAEREGLAIVGAEYCLETGVVDFFEGVRDGDSGRAARDGAAAR